MNAKKLPLIGEGGGVFTALYAVTFPFLPIGVKINKLFNYVLFYQQLEYK